MAWLVVHTKTRAEEEAATQLERQGYTVFLPRIRQRKRRQNRWQWVTGPLFPRYLFVEVALGEQDVTAIRSTIGVVNLVRFGHELVPVPEPVVSFLQQHQDPSLNAHTEAEWPHKPGDVVEILDGPFAGLNGVYQMARDEERVTLLVELLGRQNAVLVERQALGKTL